MESPGLFTHIVALAIIMVVSFAPAAIFCGIALMNCVPDKPEDPDPAEIDITKYPEGGEDAIYR